MTPRGGTQETRANMPTNVTAMAVLLSSLVSGALSQVLIKWRLEVHAPGGVSDIRALFRSAIFDGWLWLAFAFLLTAAALWYFAISRLPLSFAMPFASLMTPLVILLSTMGLNEQITPHQMAATAVIVAGALWLSILQST